MKKLSWEDELAAYNGGQVIADDDCQVHDHGHWSLLMTITMVLSRIERYQPNSKSNVDDLIMDVFLDVDHGCHDENPPPVS